MDSDQLRYCGEPYVDASYANDPIINKELYLAERRKLHAMDTLCKHAIGIAEYQRLLQPSIALPTHRYPTYCIGEDDYCEDDRCGNYYEHYEHGCHEDDCYKNVPELDDADEGGIIPTTDYKPAAPDFLTTSAGRMGGNLTGLPDNSEAAARTLLAGACEDKSHGVREDTPEPKGWPNTPRQSGYDNSDDYIETNNCIIDTGNMTIPFDTSSAALTAEILIDDDNCGDSDTADGPDADNEKRNSPNAELDYEYTQDVD